MTGKKDAERLRDKLVERFNEIIESRTSITDAWRELHEREVEFEEMAQKEVISQSIDQLDEQEKEEVEAIQRALGKLESGLYGSCESCGREISVQRLETLPWTPYCIHCAGGRESGPVESETEETTTTSYLPAEFQGMTDEEIKSAIWDELQEDGRVELDELEITCKNGVIYLAGVLPGKEMHYILLGIIEDTLGFKDVVDEININRQLWARRDRTHGREYEQRGKPKKYIITGGEDIEEDIIEARTTGEPLSPPDEIIPEKGEE
ncbi:MAG: TraR/DksA C4-type zinc finger protein [Desulfurivibrionaceae bacterium]